MNHKATSNLASVLVPPRAQVKCTVSNLSISRVPHTADTDNNLALAFARHVRTRLSSFQSPYVVGLQMTQTPRSRYSKRPPRPSSRCTTVPPDTDVHVQGLTHRRPSGRVTTPRHTMPSLQRCSIPCGSPCLARQRALWTSDLLLDFFWPGLARYEDRTTRPGHYTVLWRLQVAACTLPGTAFLPTDDKDASCRYRRWVLTCDAAR